MNIFPPSSENPFNRVGIRGSQICASLGPLSRIHPQLLQDGVGLVVLGCRVESVMMAAL